MHYLLNFSQDRMAEAVNQGVEEAREWCRAHNIPLTPGPSYPPAPSPSANSIQFTEEMKGFVSAGANARARPTISRRPTPAGRTTARSCSTST